MVGEEFDSKINQLSGIKQRKIAQKYKFEKSCCRRVSVLKKHLFPVYNDTKFVTESTVWEKCNKEYDSYYVNDVFRVYYENTTDSIMNSKSKYSYSRFKSRYYFSLFCLNELYSERKYNENYKVSRFNYPRSAICCRIKYKEAISKINNFNTKLFITFIGYPVAFLYVIIKKERRKSK